MENERGGKKGKKDRKERSKEERLEKGWKRRREGGREKEGELLNTRLCAE